MDKSNMVMGDPKQSQTLENKLLDEVVESQGQEPTSAASGKENADVNEGDHATSVANNNFDFVKEQTAARTNGGGFEEENFPGNGIVGESANENVSREEDPTEIVAENKRPQKIVDEDGNPVTNVSEEEKLGECSTMEKISSENGQVPTELSAMEAPLNEGDPAHAEDEKMIDVIHEVEDETAKDELKEPGSKIVSASIVTDRNSRFSETADPLNEGDPPQPEDENMADVVHENEDEMVDERKESDNQNVSSSSVTHGNPKLSETAASVEEGGPAQDEDEKMADVVHENKDVTVKDELKEPGNEIVSASAVTDGNLKFSGHAIPVNEGDPAQPEDEKIADVVRGNEDHDKLKEPGDQIVSAGNVIDGNAKLSESATPLKEGDPMHTEIEKISNVVHEDEDETVINKLKGPGNEICSASSATDGNDKSSESAIPMTEGDTLQSEEEKIADVVHENEDKTVHSNLKEPGNEIDSTSDVTCGNAKLSESATPLDEDNPAQPEDEKMSDVVRKNQDEIVDDKLKGPDNEIVSASTHTIGNAKLSESASVNEGDRAQPEEEQIADVIHENEDKTVNNKLKEPGNEIVSASAVTYRNAKLSETTMKSELDDASLPVTATPNSLVKYSTSVTGDHSEEIVKTISHAEMVEDDDGTPEDQVAFMKELERFYREKSMDFKPLKFYGQPLNCLKLWRAVIRLGGYDRVTGLKLWRQVGESFHPPKTCTTVSWTFRIFYEKSLLEYERHKTQSGELQLPDFAVPDTAGAYVEGNGHQGMGSGRTRRDAAARAMQGWHVQRVSGHGEVGEPIIKDKNLSNVIKREKNLKSIGSLKQKRPNEEELSVKAARTETSKQPVASVVDVGPPADWVRINVQQAKDCFEVYALVPGLLREEVRVQSDPAGRLVITGQPEHLDNPWGITPFRKVVTFPTRIDPVRTSAVVSLHGRLLIHVPFEQ